MDIKSYKDLIIWQKSIELVKEVYIFTETFPKSELYGIVSQMRRAAISIPSNIAEGYGRNSRKEYAHALSIARGSALELETQIIIAKELSFGRQEAFMKADYLLEEVVRMVYALRMKIKVKS